MISGLCAILRDVYIHLRMSRCDPYMQDDKPSQFSMAGTGTPSLKFKVLLNLIDHLLVHTLWWTEVRALQGCWRNGRSIGLLWSESTVPGPLVLYLITYLSSRDPSYRSFSFIYELCQRMEVDKNRLLMSTSSLYPSRLLQTLKHNKIGARCRCYLSHVFF
jgi:hypothetical protein